MQRGAANTGTDIEVEMTRQVYEDGEITKPQPDIRCWSTQLFTTALLLMRSDRAAPTATAFVDRLRMMFEFLNVVASTSGQLPQVGGLRRWTHRIARGRPQQMVQGQVAERNSLRVSHLLGLGQRLFGVGGGPLTMPRGTDSRYRIPYAGPQLNVARPVQSKSSQSRELAF